LVVEIGTYLGQGTLALSLGADSVVTYDITDWRSFPTTVLRESDFDFRIEQRIGDLSDPDFFASQLDTLLAADVIFVDGPKDGVFERVFGTQLYEAIRGSGAVVIWDDIRLLAMVDVWRRFTVHKLDATSFGHWSGTGITHSYP
jgi:predicted O-methyltransferase YrrM